MLTEFLGPARSICPVCLKPLLGQRLRDRAGNVYLDRTCPEHGDVRELVWEGALDWSEWGEGSCENPADFGSQTSVPDLHLSSNEHCPHGCDGCTQHILRPCCVLLELTQRCNLGCPVCFAQAGGDAPDDPSLETIGTWFDRIIERTRYANIQLSGGEPTLRDDLPQIVELGRAKGFEYFQVNTNGLRLASDPAYASVLRDAGVSCVFLQFDAVDDDAYRIIRGRSLLEVKKAAIAACAEARLPVVLVPTVVRGVNDDQLGAIVHFAVDHAPTVRGIHVQPLARFGRFPAMDAPRITLPGVLGALEEQTGGMVERGHFRGGETESVYCSFSASYRIDRGTLVHIPAARPSCCVALDVQDAVARARQANSMRWGGDLGLLDETLEEGSLDAFLAEKRRSAFSITGMEFMDARSLDLERLERCYIFIVRRDGELIPFCAYNLTADDGTSLYRKGTCAHGQPVDARRATIEDEEERGAR